MQYVYDVLKRMPFIMMNIVSNIVILKFTLRTWSKFQSSLFLLAYNGEYYYYYYCVYKIFGSLLTRNNKNAEFWSNV